MATLKTIRGTFKFKQRNMYVGIKRINKKIAQKNLLDAKEILDKGGLYFGLMFGTLLGAIREHDFITHDQDIDLFILSEDEEKFKSILFDLREAGFELIRYERFGLYSIYRDGDYIDFFSMKPFTKGVRYTGAADYLLEKYLLETTYIEFKGSKFRVPKKNEEFLEFFYGANWRTPIEYANYELSKYKIAYLKFQSFAKRSLPDFLYHRLIYRHHKTNREDFFNKCVVKNIDFNKV